MNSRDKEDRTPLHVASQNGHLDVIRWLLDRGADVNALEVNGKTPLSLALDEGKIEASRLLLERGADANLRDTWYCSPCTRHCGPGILRLCRNYSLTVPMSMRKT